MRPRIRSMVTVAVVASSLALTLGVNSASATDPDVTPRASDVVGVGSDTTQDVMGLRGPTLATSGYGPNFNAGTTSFKLYGFDALGSTPITTTAGCNPITRPNGSSSGISALLADEVAGTSCIDYARSSRAKGTSDGDLVFVPYATDGVTWGRYPRVVGGTTYNSPVNLTTAQLTGIYDCTFTDWSQVGGRVAPIRPYLPQSGSGTRSFFLSSIGITTPGPCVIQPTVFEENNGSQVPAPDRPNAVLPYSIAKYVAQKSGVSLDTRSGVTLGNINGTRPLTSTGALNTKFTASNLRQVFNVIKPADLAKTSIKQIFGRNGYICNNPTISRTFGFAPLPKTSCGFV